MKRIKQLLIMCTLLLIVSVGMTTKSYAWSFSDPNISDWESYGQSETGLIIYTDAPPATNWLDLLGRTYGFKDSNGNIVIPAIYRSPQYANGRIIVTNNESETGIIDTKGNVVFPFGSYFINYYKEVDVFNTSVERFGGNAIIYDSNFQIISKTYDFVNYIGEDLFLVGTGGKDGLYKVGKGEVIPCKYDRLKELESNTNKDSRLFVSQANKSVATVGLYDEDGAQVLPAEYTTIESAYDNYIVVGKFKDEKYRSLCGEEVDKFTIVNGIMVVGLGVVDIHNNMLIPPIYNKVSFNKKDGNVALGLWNGRTEEETGFGGEINTRYYYDMTYIPISALKSEWSNINFKDVAPSAYYFTPVKWAVENNITSGTSATTFSPNQTCTNAHILTFLWRAKGSPEPAINNPFVDVKTTDYYYKAALWAYDNGLISGNQFGGSAPCTRGTTVTYLWKLAGSPDVGESSFADAGQYSSAVAWAVKQGITSGTSATTFSPDKACTRGQIVTFLYRDLG